MSRSRNIKPGFFKNEALAELPFEYRLLFQGLWCEADRAGRLEDRPKRLKAEIFPYDDVDVEAGLQALADHGFIIRYTAQGRGNCIFITAFEKHQNPHKKEAPSIIPEFDPDEHRASTVPVPEIPERATLIPDSLNLIPDSLLDPAYAGLFPADAGNDQATGVDEQPKGRPPCPQQQIVDLYHQTLPELRRMREWNETRRRLLARRWSESPERQTLDWWAAFFGYVRQSPFLMGRTLGRDGRPFDCDLEWLIRPNNFAKVVEGKYEDQAA